MSQAPEKPVGVLIIDDEQVLARTLAAIFTQRGFRVAWASTAAAGRALLQDDVAVVLLDLKLPDAIGTDVLRDVKRRRPDIQVIMMTAFATLESATAVMKEGAYGYLIKPFDINELLEMVRKALDQQQRLHQEHELLANLSLAYKISKEMEGVIELQSVAALAVRYLAETLSVDSSGVLLRDQNTNNFFFAAVRGVAVNNADLLDKRFRLDPVFFDQLIQKKQALLIPALTSRPAILEQLAISAPQSLFMFPLVVRKKTIGLALFVSRRRMQLSDADVARISTVSDEIAACLSNALRYVELKQRYMNAVTALHQAADQREGWEGDDDAIVADMAAAVARQLGLTREEIEAVRIAGLLHDIGRVVISEQILLKKGSLTTDEYAAVKRHSTVAAGIMSHLDAEKRIMPIILHHHERLDGRGYPNGLLGEAIPLGARILAVCDAFQSMVSERPYRSAMTAAEALLELRRCSGSQFDGRVVDAFMRVRAEHPSGRQGKK